MALTFWRWGAGLALGCGAIAVALTPFPPSVADRWTNAVPSGLGPEVKRLATDVGRAQATLRAYRSATGLQRWRNAARASDTSSVRIDRSVPEPLGPDVRTAVLAQWSALGAASAPHAEVFVYVDSVPVTRAGNAATSRRALEPRRLVDVVFALPEATDGTRCVSLVRLLGTSPAHVDALRQQSLVGVCGFFAAFGMPGATNRRWLTAVDYRVARRSDWHVALAPMTDASAIYGIGTPGGRCLTGEPSACLGLLGATHATWMKPARTSELEFVLDGFMRANVADGARSSLGNVEGELMMAAVREFGPERFARFWTSAAPPDAAFAAATGVTLDGWVRRWMGRTFGDLPERPAPRVSHFVWVLIASPLLVLIAARPRDRVLAERER